MTYTDYLQRRELDDHLAFQISQPIKDLITRNDYIAEEQLVQLNRIVLSQAETTEAVYQVVEEVSYLREETREGFRRVGAVLEWGFSELIFQQTRTNDLLAEILNALKTPSLTWAYEQFERARDRYRRRHFVEALESVDKAINGYANQIGDNTEHRFHYLTGIIKLGSFENHDEQVVDLDGAEQAFVLAARYAKHDYPQEAAKALLCASRAANLRSRYEVSRKYAFEGLAYDGLAGLHYELAVAEFNLGNIAESGRSMQQSIRLDKSLLTRYIGDPNFNTAHETTRQTLESLYIELNKIADEAIAALSGQIQALKETTFSEDISGRKFSLSSTCPEVTQRLLVLRKSIEDCFPDGGILDIRESLENLAEVEKLLVETDDKFRSEIEMGLRVAASALQESEKTAAGIEKNSSIASAEAMSILWVIVGILVSVWELLWGYPAIYLGPGNYSDSAFFSRLVLSAGILFGAIWSSAENKKSAEASAEARAHSRLGSATAKANDIRNKADLVRNEKVVFSTGTIDAALPVWIKPYEVRGHNT